MPHPHQEGPLGGPGLAAAAAESVGADAGGALGSATGAPGLAGPRPFGATSRGGTESRRDQGFLGGKKAVVT